MANDASGKIGGNVGQTAGFQGIWLLVGGVGLALVGFMAGRLSLTPTLETASAHEPALLLVQNEDPRELIPLPGPGLEPGMQPEGECPIYLYQDGQLYRLMPGGPDGTFPEGSPELFPLEPVPRSPAPRQEPSPPERRPGIRT